MPPITSKTSKRGLTPSNASIRKRVFRSAELGTFIKRLRKEQHLSQFELAEQANVARSAIQKLEEGKGTVNLDTAIKILSSLSLDLGVISRTNFWQISEDETLGR